MFDKFNIITPIIKNNYNIEEEIVKYCEYNDTIIKQLEKEIENNKKQADIFIKSIIKKLPSEIED